MHPRLLSVGACVLALTGLGCGAEEPAQRASLAITGGELSGAEHDAVVFVSVTLDGTVSVTKVGSGTLVAPNLLATALHVVAASPPSRGFTCSAEGEDLSGGGADLEPPVAPKQVQVFLSPDGGEPDAVGLEIISSGSTTFCQNDIAFVVLDKPLSPAPIPVHLGAAAALGDVLTVVGFGTESGDSGPLRRMREVDVQAVAQWPRTFTVTVGPCPGDSGGPALSEQGELMGVFSTVGSNCRGASAAPKYTDISYFSALVERAFLAAGAEQPGSAGEGGAGGEAGEGGEGGAGKTTANDSAPKTEGCACRAPSGSTGDRALVGMLALLIILRVRRGSPT